MEININTPALLFPAISLLLLAYTNRFLAIASLVRNLHNQYQSRRSEKIIRQIENLRMRLNMIRYMQALGVSSLFLAILCMFLLFFNQTHLTSYIFGLSLFLLMLSLAFSIREILISIHALNIELSDLEEEETKK